MNREEIQDRALEALLEHKRGAVDVSMGVGKTLIGLKYIDHWYKQQYYLEHNFVFNKRTHAKKFLVVIPKVSVKQSWLDDMVKFDMKYLKPYIEFTTYVSLNKKRQEWTYAVILDECHSITDIHYKWLYKFCKEYTGNIIGLTGTYPNVGVKFTLCNGFCPRVFKYTPDDAVNDHILNDYRIVVHMLPLDERKNREKKDGNGKTFKSSEKADYDYWNSRCNDFYKSYEDKMKDAIMRMKILQSFKSKETYAQNLYNEQEDKTILFASTTTQADRIDRHSYHSKNWKSESNLNDFKSGKITKLTCVQQLNEGVTIPGLKVGIILHSFGNNRQASQKIGRCLRLSTDQTATIHILCYENTVDEKWVRNALYAFDQQKIKYKKAKFYGS